MIQGTGPRQKPSGALRTRSRAYRGLRNKPAKGVYIGPRVWEKRHSTHNQTQNPIGKNEMLTPQTQIPTAARGQVRSLVKASAGWAAFLTEKGLISASARNADLIEYALRHPMLAAQIEAVLQGHTSPQAPADGPEAMMEDEAA